MRTRDREVCETRIFCDHITRRCVRTAGTNSPLYDIVLASRHPKAIELWDKANVERKPPTDGVQLGFGDVVE